MIRSRLLALVAVCLPATLVAQSPAAQSPAAPTFMPTDAQILAFIQNLPITNASPFAPLINGLLSDTAGHMRMAPHPAASAADSARAAAIVRTARTALAPYRDVAAAQRDGFVRMMPWLEEQVIYHYNNLQNAQMTAAAFDAAKPTSLLYRKDAKGAMVLVGAMYTAPGTLSDSALDARLPLGIAHWHQHVNFCGMKFDVASKVAQSSDGETAKRWLAIETKEACDAEGGLFLPRLFGWMAHVNVFAGDDPQTIWGHEGRDQMHMHSHH